MDTGTVSVASRSIWTIVGDVFLAPVKAFDAYKLKPTIVVPLILTIVLAALSGGLPYKQGAEAQIEMLSTSTTLPPPVLEQMRQSAENPSPISSTLGGGIGLVIISLLGALLAWFIGSFILGKKAKYSHVWGVEMLAGLIGLVGAVLRSLLVVAKDDLFVSIGPAALMPGKDFTSILYSIFYFADVFAIWSMIVAGVGYAAIFGFSRGKGIAVSLTVWLVSIIIFVSMQLIGLSIAGVKVTFI